MWKIPSGEGGDTTISIWYWQLYEHRGVLPLLQAVSEDLSMKVVGALEESFSWCGMRNNNESGEETES